MKKILFFVAILAMGTANAQNEMAILSHNETMSAFYGTNALIEAIDSAAPGDVITLSSGYFKVQDFNKNKITVRGNGFEEDMEAGGVKPTVITHNEYGSNMIAVYDSVVLEGMMFNSEVRFNGHSGMQVSKCMFNSLSMSNSHNAEVVDCFITILNTNGCDNAIITNSILFNVEHGASRLQVMNSIVIPQYDYLFNGSYGTFTNCILLSNGYNNVQTACYNCIGINPNGTFFADAINWTEFQSMSQAEKDSVLAVADQSHGNYNAYYASEVFKTYRGSEEYSPRLDFSLTPQYDTLIAELGVYRGMMPYSPFVNRPRFVRSNVAPRTTLDGKLSIDIEVITIED